MRILSFFKELFIRFRLAYIIIFYGDLINGNLKRLRAMLAELEFISTHQDDLEKAEIISLVVGDLSKPQTGMLHHLQNVLTSHNWRIIAAEMRDAELLAAKERVMAFLREVRSGK